MSFLDDLVRTYMYMVKLRSLQPTIRETQGHEPLLLTTGSFTCITRHMGPTSLSPIQREETIMVLSVLLKDTSYIIKTWNPHSIHTLKAVDTIGNDSK